MKTHKSRQLGMVGHIEILVAVVVLSAVGFGAWRVMTANNDNAKDTPKASVSSQEKTENLPTDLTDIKSIDEIKTLATDDVATVSGIELELEEGTLVYVVHFTDGSKTVFNAKTGSKLQLTDNNNDEIDDSKTLPAGFTAAVSIQQAIDIAKKERPDATLRKVELEVEDGTVVYSVRFTDGSRVDVSAADGTVQRVKQAKEGGNSSSSAGGDSSGSGSNGSSTSGSGGSHSSDDSNDDDSQSSSDDGSSDDSTDDSGNDSSSDQNDTDEDSSGGGSNSGSGSSGHGSGHN